MNLIIDDWENSCLCLEDGMEPAAANLINLQSIYNECLEGEYMVLEESIKYCECGCGLKTTINGDTGIFNKYIHGHNRRGIRTSDETKSKMSKSQLGKKHTEQAKKIMSKTRTGRILSKEHKRKISEAGKGRRHREESKRKLSKAKMGNKNPNWNNGASFEPYCHKFNEQKREEIREQYGRKCYLCKKTEEDNGRKLSVHHVDYSKDQGCNGKAWELVPLCSCCHSMTNSNQEKWKDYIYNKLRTTKHD